MSEAGAKKSVIIGCYRHTIESPRLHFPGAELWMQSNAIRNWDFALHDWSRWFDVHTEGPQAGYAGIRLLRPDILGWYEKQGPERPIYFTDHIPSVRASTVYPLAEMKARFGGGRFGCQLDYMMALALSEGFERIIFYGNGAPYVDDPSSDKARKYITRHCSVLYWIGRAEATGVEVVFDGPSMFRPFDGDYGYDMGPK
jgi:hypothetical protein